MVLGPRPAILRNFQWYVRVNSNAGLVLTPWFKKLMFYDPASVWAQIRCPVLAINGDITAAIRNIRATYDLAGVTVIDRDGNAVSNTYTLNLNYGVGLVAEGTGVLLNNEMDDFTSKVGVPNDYVLLSGGSGDILRAVSTGDATRDARTRRIGWTVVLVFLAGLAAVSAATLSGAMRDAIEHVLVVRRHGRDGEVLGDAAMRDGRDIWWHDLVDAAAAEESGAAGMPFLLEQQWPLRLDFRAQAKAGATRIGKENYIHAGSISDQVTATNVRNEFSRSQEASDGC